MSGPFQQTQEKRHREADARSPMRAPIPDFMLGAKCLPAADYTDESRYRAEVEKCYRNNWISIGLASQVPEPNDVLPVEFDGESLLITRDRSGNLHVLYNVCRHRGLRLIEGTEVTKCKTGALSCPYHKWAYHLDGALRAAPYFDGTKTFQPSEEMKQSHGLQRVRSALWHDIIFINLSGDAKRFDDYIAPLNARWESFDFSLLRRTHSKSYNLKANWKLACENFLDTYHVPYVHSALGTADEIFPGLEFNYLSDELFGFTMPDLDRCRDALPEVPPLFPSRALKFDYALDLVYMYPNTLMMVTPSWFQLITVLPLAAGRTREILTAYLVGDEILSEKWEAHRNTKWQEFDGVNLQDMEILEKLQAGRASKTVDDSAYAPFWDQLSQFMALRIQADFTRQR